MWITWSNTATARTGSVTATDKLTAAMDFRLYTLALSTETFPVDTAATPINA